MSLKAAKIPPGGGSDEALVLLDHVGSPPAKVQGKEQGARVLGSRRHPSVLLSSRGVKIYTHTQHTHTTHTHTHTQAQAVMGLDRLFVDF